MALVAVLYAAAPWLWVLLSPSVRSGEWLAEGYEADWSMLAGPVLWLSIACVPVGLLHASLLVRSALRVPLPPSLGLGLLAPVAICFVRGALMALLVTLSGQPTFAPLNFTLAAPMLLLFAPGDYAALAGWFGVVAWWLSRPPSQLVPAVSPT